MGRWFSKPVPKPSEPTLPRPKSRAVQHESPNSERVKSNRYRESAEARTFRECFSLLVDGISDARWLAIQLYSKGFIGRDLRTEAEKPTIKERVKVDELLSAVEDHVISINPATKFRLFVDVLRNEPSLQHLATKLESTCCEMSGLYAPNPPTPSGPHIDTYTSYLKSVYTREKLPTYDKWPLVGSKKYINLALVNVGNVYITKREREAFTKATIHGNIDDIKQSKRAMDISQVAQLPDGSHPKCILVEGAPGVGKSTFAWKLCCRWGEGKLLQQYKLVVLLRLRDKTVRASKSISDLFQYRNHQVQQAVIEEIQRTHGKGVLLIFEGYDELPEEMRIENSIFLDVITGRELPEATVIVTSRSWASEFLHRECTKHISQHIEILGFTKDDIMSYLESTMHTFRDPSLLAGLKKYISCYPHINSAMYIPLNAAIVVEVYRNSRKDDRLVPKTMTEMYSSLVRCLLLRHLFDHPVHGQKRWRVRNFSDLPPDVHQQLCELGKIAYEGIVDGQKVIFSDLPEDFEMLGLIQFVLELYADEGAAVSYNFLHLTVQEYLAAFHLSQQLLEKQIEHYQKFYGGRKQMPNHFQMVLRFLSGLRKFGGYPKKMLNTLCEKITLDTLCWLFEAQDSDVLAELLGVSDIELNVRWDAVTPFDCFVLGYCVSHSNCTWKIDLGHCHIGDEGVEMLVRGAVEEETNCTGGISEIVLSMNDITSEGVDHLLKFPRKLINNLGTLDLSGNELNSESCVTIARLIPHMPLLKKLNLSYNVRIGPGGTVLLIRSLTSQNSLEELDLYCTAIDVEDCQALSDLLSLSTSLKDLNIGGDLPPEGVEWIISGLHHNTTLKQLHMHNTHFSPQNSISLAAGMTTNHTLVDLTLVNCYIDSDGACRLASALCTNDTLLLLNISDNPIGVKGAAAFAEVLLTNRSLKELYLENEPVLFDFETESDYDPIGVEGTQTLIESLTHNSTLEKLYLSEVYQQFIATTMTDQELEPEIHSQTDRVIWW